MDSDVSVVCHRACFQGNDRGEGVGHIMVEAKSFPPDTPVSEILNWATGDNSEDDFERVLQLRRKGLFRVELSIPSAPDRFPLASDKFNLHGEIDSKDEGEWPF